MITYLINLASREDRLRTARMQLSKLETNYVRIEGVIYPQEIMDQEGLVTSGVKGCWESHKLCFEDLTNSEEEYALVCEDDLSIRDIKSLSAAISWGIRNEVDLLQLGFLLQGVRNHLTFLVDFIEHVVFKTFFFFSKLPIVGGFGLEYKLRVLRYGQTPLRFVPDSFLPGTHCYLISRKMAESVRLLNAPQFLSADDFFIALTKMRSFKTYRVAVSTVSQNNSKASIEKRFTGTPE